MKLTTRVVFHHAILIFLTLILFPSRSTAQNNLATTPARITQAVDENNLVTLSGNVHPLARAQFDRGPAPSELALDRMLLVLSRSPEQAGSLQALLDQQQDKSSPQYRRWLTPQQFGQQFGPSDSDIGQITSWLQIHGFHDIHVSNGRVTIEFSGTAAQVQEAFHAPIHRYVVNGAEHWANAANPQIPAALAPVVAGVFTLHNFLKAPQSQVTPQAFPATVTAGKRPQFTGGNGSHAIAPADFYTIYNFNAFKAAPPFGNSASVAIVARTNINVGDVENFLQYTLNGGAVPQVLVNGADPGDLGGGEEAEAVLDASWVAAASPFASITLVVSQSTATTDGLDLSENYIIDNNFADVMSESFGSCEANFTSAEAIADSSLAQQAATEGITYVVSSGDSGAEGCDDPNNETVATHLPSVNLLASNPYVLAVGGTIFDEGSNPSKYWNATNNSIPLSSAISYIPENVWNESCQSSQPNCSTPSIWAGGGGASTFFTKPSWQTGVPGIPADNARDLPDVSLTAAGHDPYLICLDGSCVPDS